MSFIGKFAATALLGSAMLVTAIAAPAYAQEFEDMNFTVIIYTDASVEFWVPAIAGINDAAAQLGVNVDIQYGDSKPEKQNDIIQAAIANQVDGIALTIYNDEAFGEAICQAEESGIIVIAFNADHALGSQGSCRSAYVGQNEVAAGELIAQYMVDNFDLKEGDKVLAPVEIPEASYAVDRSTGVKNILEPLGIAVDVIRSTTNPAEAQTLISQYLLANSDVDAIIGLGQTPTNAAPASMKELGVELPLGGFDLSQDIARAIKSGVLAATVDQQPYLQGYYIIQQMALNKRYGLSPANISTSGTGLVDAASVDAAIEFMGTTR